jgi:type IV secretory pathway VirB2 component (pilin)
MKSKKRTLLATLLALGLVAVTAFPAYAAPMQDALGFEGIIDGILGLITDIAKPVAVLGLAGWGLAQFAQPFAPELNSKFQGYSTKILFGAVLVLGASTIADWIFSIGA